MTCYPVWNVLLWNTNQSLQTKQYALKLSFERFCRSGLRSTHILARVCERSGAAKFPAHRSDSFTGVPLTAPFPLGRPPAPSPLTLHLIFWTALTAPPRSFDFLTRFAPAPLRSKARFKGGGSQGRTFPHQQRASHYTCWFFCHFSQLGTCVILNFLWT